ncbi:MULTISPECIES: SDR family NAD(P)-dependent oxidoreductase [Niastella]|uniref:SDR family oxidoreductase n=1 Tax=Niastella soli TaxID=2821487 RepID=A0ABS3Z2G9_9BACT|nr:SDR family oxidoreductase [Niastella soli]MBO9204361.1 SDR family oxidoreductase [Niastella soli]
MDTNNGYTLITGGTSGIGFELAKIFAYNGHDLIIVARNENGLERAYKEFTLIGVDVVTISKDLFIKESPFEVYNEVKERGLPVDILVNNAGQGQYGEFAETNIYRELDIIQLNICSLMVLTKLFLREMLQKGNGKILNLSSIASKTPGPLQSVYHGTKAFVQSFTEAVRNEVKDTGVTLTALLPGVTDTDFFNKAQMQESRIVTEGVLDDPVKVAKDGYDALMRGDDMVISGFRNKMTVTLSNILPDHVAAENIHKRQAPVNKKK